MHRDKHAPSELLPSACEVNVTGVLPMYLLQAFLGIPRAIIDWNNNYQGDPDKGAVFNCSSSPKYFLERNRVNYQEIIVGTVAKREHVRHSGRTTERR
jgi:L-fucose isomerase-like protein